MSRGDLAWQDGTQACADPGIDPEWFFTEDHKMQIAATAICMRCPLLDPCAQYALTHDVRGVWGGMSERSLAANRRNMKIRPKAISGDNYYYSLFGYPSVKRVP
jgi:WhiB family redox-sensing transcriptional regulator